MRARSWASAAALAATLVLGGCTTLDYYAHVLRGGYDVLAGREPISGILDDPARDAALKARLSGVQAARQFAVTALALPDNGSYTSYTDLKRRAVVWNVFATEGDLSLTPVRHCFPIAGCVDYRGYFGEARAEAEAARLAAEGRSTVVWPVAAYSTLGFFADPVLNTMLGWDDERLAALVFHELAHQKVYVKNDTAFNESYAQFVEERGLIAWRVARGLDAALPKGLAFETEFADHVLATRDVLQQVYASAVPDAEKAQARDAAFAALEATVRKRVAETGAGSHTLRFFATPMTNAKLLPFGLYHQWVAAFGALFHEVGGDWPRFHAAVAALAALDADTRQQRLQALNDQADAPV